MSSNKIFLISLAFIIIPKTRSLIRLRIHDLTSIGSSQDELGSPSLLVRTIQRIW